MHRRTLPAAAALLAAILPQGMIGRRAVAQAESPAAPEGRPVLHGPPAGDAPPLSVDETLRRVSDFVDSTDLLHAPSDETSSVLDAGIGVLLGPLSRLPLDEVRKRVRPGVTVRNLLDDPAGLRAAAVRLTGAVVWTERRTIAPNSGGLEAVHLSFLLDDHWRPLIVYSAEAPPPIHEPCKDRWEVEGVFLKAVDYRSESGADRTAPLVLARNIGRASAEAPPPAPPLWLFAAGASALVIVVIAVALRSGRNNGFKPRPPPPHGRMTPNDPSTSPPDPDQYL